MDRYAGAIDMWDFFRDTDEWEKSGRSLVAVRESLLRSDGYELPADHSWHIQHCLTKRHQLSMLDE
jgi:hypothetical protein